MNRRTIALKVFTIALITVLYLIFFSISLVIRANANERSADGLYFGLAHLLVPYRIADDAGLFKKYGLDVEMLFINGSTRGIQSLLTANWTSRAPSARR